MESPSTTTSCSWRPVRAVSGFIEKKIQRDAPLLSSPAPPSLSSFCAAFGDLEASDLTTFVDNGGNLFVAGSSDVSSPVRALGHAFGVDFDPAKARVIDHIYHHKATDSGKHTRVLSDSYFPSKYLVGSELATAAGKSGGRPAIAYEGGAMTTSPDNIFAVRTLTASNTGYSAKVSEPIQGSYPYAAGSEAILVASVQSRNNARATFTGSLWMLSDEAFNLQADASSGGATIANEKFARAVLRWTFRRSGVLFVSSVRHSHADGTAPEHQVEHSEKRDMPPSMFPEPEIARQSLVYRIKDDIRFGLDLAINTGNGTVVPYEEGESDGLQLEFVMLDPYIRTALKKVESASKGSKGSSESNKRSYEVVFKAPDVYGIFQFRVMFRRPALSTLLVKEQVSVRPFRHNEYERFITSAYPYYTAAFAMMAGVFVFSFFFLYSSTTATATAGAVAAAAVASSGAAGESSKNK